MSWGEGGHATLPADKQAAALAGAITQATTPKKGEVLAEDIAAVQETLTFNGKTEEQWFGDLVFNATFLGVPIRPSGGDVPGVHRSLDAALRTAETKLGSVFPTLSRKQIAKKMGIYEISGVRPPKKATGGELPSYHCFGLAVDINHPTNPFIGNMKPKKKKSMTDDEKAKYQQYLDNRSPRIIERAMRLLHNEDFNVEAKIKVPAGEGSAAGRLWEIHKRASDTLAEYLRLADDLNGDKLRGLVDSLRKAGGEHDLAWWQDRIATDRVQIKNWDFMHSKTPQTTGYMDLGKELVEALVAAGLYWGGQYPKAKDMMHFDLREGTLERPKKK